MNNLVKKRSGHMPSRIITVIIAVFLITSCTAEQTIKKEPPAVAIPSQPVTPAPEVKPPEPPQPQKAVVGREETGVKKIKRQEPVIVEEGADGKYVVLNFDGADIETVISTMGEMLNLNYILAPGVKGKVTIQSYKKFPMRDLLQIFQTILEVNGLTAVRDGEIYRIVPVDSAKQQPLQVQSGRDVKLLQMDSGFITQLIPLEYVKASDIVKITRNLMPRGADLVVYEPSNMLIVTAPPYALLKFMKIVEALDIPSIERESVRTFVYYVENGEAKKLADILKTLYAGKKAAGRRTPAVPPVTMLLRRKQSLKRKTKVTATTVKSIPGEVEGDIVITPYEDINALIIKSTPKSYLTMLEVLRKLDIPAKQVLIEVLIAEVSLTDRTQFGIEWMLKTLSNKHDTVMSGFTSESQPGSVSPNIDSGTGKVTNIITFPSVGTAFAAIIRPERYGVLLNAFASLGKLNVLASPHILAMDNKEARIEIGEEIPIATGFQQQPATSTTTGTTSFVAAGQIQYRTTGIILTVTPNISEKKMVKLKINQEISNRGVDVSLAGITSPSFTTRKAETVGVVKSGRTLIIGGLISEQNSNSREGIPLLSRIPLIGYLFGVRTKETKKTELLVMVTPYVVSSMEEVDAITRKFRNRVKTIKKRLEEIQRDKAADENPD
jgi:general secretion pathway protein D